MPHTGTHIESRADGPPLGGPSLYEHNATPERALADQWFKAATVFWDIYMGVLPHNTGLMVQRDIEDAKASLVFDATAHEDGQFIWQLTLAGRGHGREVTQLVVTPGCLWMRSVQFDSQGRAMSHNLGGRREITDSTLEEKAQQTLELIESLYNDPNIDEQAIKYTKKAEQARAELENYEEKIRQGATAWGAKVTQLENEIGKGSGFAPFRAIDFMQLRLGERALRLL